MATTTTGTLYHIGDEHRSRYVDGKWGIDGSTPSIMAVFTKLCGKGGASEAKLRAHCASVGNKGFFAYALRNGWVVAVGDSVPPTKTKAQRASTRDGVTADEPTIAKPKAKRDRKAGKSRAKLAKAKADGASRVATAELQGYVDGLPDTITIDPSNDDEAPADTYPVDSPADELATAADDSVHSVGV